MKIRIIKEIPEAKKGDIFPVNGGFICTENTNYRISSLIKEGFAEEIKDDIDIEKIRQEEDVKYFSLAGADIKPSESEFLQAFRVVSRVIEELNGDWEADWEDREQDKFDIRYEHSSKEFHWSIWNEEQYSMLPSCKSRDVVEKLVSLVEPELKTLFHIK